MELTKENLRNVNIKDLALNPKFGSLTFDKSRIKLEKIQKWFTEFQELDYINELPENVSINIDNHIDQFIAHLQWLEKFDIATIPNAREEHDNFESRTDSFYNTVFNNFVTTNLHFLRQEVELRSKDRQNLAQQQKEVQQIKKNTEEIFLELQNELTKLKAEKEQVASKKGEIAAVRFGKHFENEAKAYAVNADLWLNKRDNFFKWLLRIVLCNFSLYIFLFITNKLQLWPFFPPKEFFTIEYGIVNLALLSLLSYAVSFSSKNYNVNSNLETTNKHRKNVSETLTDFLASGVEQEEKLKILEQATSAIFKHLPNGYLPKIESKDDGPVQSLIDTLLRK